jgi:hypothetical protein
MMQIIQDRNGVVVGYGPVSESEFEAGRRALAATDRLLPAPEMPGTLSGDAGFSSELGESAG